MTYYNTETFVYLDGQFLKATEATGNLYSQTLHYGYGAFEGIRSYQTSSGTQVFKAREHYERLRNSCNLLHIPFAYDLDQLATVTNELLEMNQLHDAYIRPLVYTDPNMSLSKPSAVHLLISAWSWGAYLGEQQLSLCTSPYERPNPKSLHVAAKACGHYVNSILATIDAREKGFDEALLLDARGFVAEGPGANLFMEKDGCLYTPALGNILPGITRSTVFELCAQLDIPCEERLFTVDELKKADSAFYCGTAAEIVGINNLDDYVFPQAWKGSLGQKVQELYSQWVRKPHAKSQLMSDYVQ